ncbi:ABC transporter permease [Thermoactinospora rubra]|uniref:ABC transporter permease n=1 Tax=Thermoactinospora rubra TaxID=1088767 RepID=UPI001301E257|nr:ABC transporter permease [Thermoactinospora rubra]
MVRELVAVARLGGRVYWRDRVTLGVSVALSLLLGIGMPVLMARLGVPGVAELHVGLLAMLMTLTAFGQGATVLAARRDQLLLKRMRATGLTDAAVLGGEVVNVAAQSLLISCAIAAALSLLGAVPPPANPALFALVMAAGALAQAVLGAAYTPAISRAEVASVMTMPFFLLTGVGAGGFGPLRQALPAWAGQVLDWVPGVVVGRALAVAYAGGPVSGYILPAVQLALWTAAGLAAVRLWFRWDPRR